MRHKFACFSVLFLALLLSACNPDFFIPPAAPAVPAAPTGLTVTPGDGSIMLRWQDNSSDETGFAIFKQTLSTQSLNAQQDDGLVKLTTVAANTTEYEDKNVVPGTLYRYGVAAEGATKPSAVAEAEGSVSVPAENRAPSAAAQKVSTPANKAVAVTLTGSDPDGDALTYKVVTSPTHGSLSGTAPKLTYTPNKDYSGPDSFTFTVSDGQATSAAATVSIAVSAADKPPVNRAPVANAQEVSTEEDTSVTITLTGSDPEGDALTFVILGQPSKGGLGAVDQGTGKVVYTPSSNANGPDSFTFVVSDGELASAPVTVTVNLGVVNDAPAAKAQTVQTDEDTAVTITLNATDDDGDKLTYSVVTAPTKGSLSTIDQGTGKLTYTPDTDTNGADSFTFKANDGFDDSAEVTVSILVTAVNDAPEIAGSNPVTVAVSEDGSPVPFTLTLSASDVDSATLSWSVSGNPDHGSAGVTNGVVSYSPEANFFGSDSFKVSVSDGTLNDTVTVNVIVESVNDAPTANAQTLTTAEDTALNVTLTGADVDGDTLAYAVVTQPSGGTLSGTAPNLTYTPNKDFNGSDSFTFRVSDNSLDSAPATVNITVTPVNDAPAFTSTPVTTGRKDAAYSYGVTATDPDAGDTLTLVATTKPAWLTLTGNGNGSATLSGTPTDAGDYDVVLSLTDGTATVMQSFTVTVGVVVEDFVVNLSRYGYSTSKSTVGATNDLGNPSGDHIYKVTVSEWTPGIYIYTYCSSFDTYLRLLDANGTEVASGSKNGGGCNSSFDSYLGFSLTAGQVYYVVVEGVGTAEGSYNLWIEEAY